MALTGRGRELFVKRESIQKLVSKMRSHGRY
jgi:hypothetical protein